MNHFIDGKIIDLRGLTEAHLKLLMVTNRNRAVRVNEEYDSLGGELFRRHNLLLPKG